MAKTLKEVEREHQKKLDEERRRTAALWLYIVKRDLMDDFLKFYIRYRNLHPQVLEKLLMEEYKNQLFATDAETNGQEL